MLIHTTSDRKLAEALYGALCKRFPKELSCWEGYGLSITYLDTITVETLKLPPSSFIDELRNWYGGFMAGWNIKK